MSFGRRIVQPVFLCLLVSAAPLHFSSEQSRTRDKVAFIAGHRLLRVHEGADSGKRKPLINYARAIFEDGNGVYWVGALRLFAYYEVRDHWADLTAKLPGNLSQWVNVISSDRVGRVWLRSGLPSRIGFFEGSSWHQVDELGPPLPMTSSNTILFTSKQRDLWFVTSGALVAFDGRRWSSPIFPPKSIELSYAGIAAQSGDKNQNAPTASNLFQNRPNADSNSIWQVPNSNSLMNEISVGLQAANGSIWLAARGAILRFRFDDNSWKVLLPKALSRVQVIYEDRKGRLWFADWEGRLCVYDVKRDRWESYELSRYFPRRQPRRITSIYQDSSGVIMIGTADAGLITFDEKSNKWLIFDEENSEPPLRGVFSIVEDRKERIWVGTGSDILVLAQR